FLSICRMSDTEMGLDVADMLCFQLGEQEMAEAGFGAYWDNNDRLIPGKEDLRDYWIEISSDRDFLGPAPSYVLIRDPVRRLCHRMIAYSISGREQAPEKVTGRKSRARLSGGNFIGRLAMHFGLVSDEGLRGLQGPKRQQVAATGAHEADEAGLAADKGAQEIPAPAQAPPPPPPSPQPRTMSLRIERIEEEMRDLRHDVAFDSTLVGSSWMPYQRRVRPRTRDASTSLAPHADDQPDP
ncbi:hypothetical protein Tco_1105907, partial [Tanacetum coccineum]